MGYTSPTAYGCIDVTIHVVFAKQPRLHSQPRSKENPSIRNMLPFSRTLELVSKFLSGSYVQPCGGSYPCLLRSLGIAVNERVHGAVNMFREPRQITVDGFTAAVNRLPMEIDK